MDNLDNEEVAVMDNLDNIEGQLVEICCSIIEKLDILKETGMITEEQYIYHTAIKKEFLNQVSSNFKYAVTDDVVKL
ncbi:MAG: hypothetical protein AB7G87_01690 [Clostridia bacterium]